MRKTQLNLTTQQRQRMTHLCQVFGGMPARQLVGQLIDNLWDFHEQNTREAAAARASVLVRDESDQAETQSDLALSERHEGGVASDQFADLAVTEYTHDGVE